MLGFNKGPVQHIWGDDQFDWKGINDAICFISDYCRKYGRMMVLSKEKYGTARITPYFYCPIKGWIPKWYTNLIHRWQSFIYRRAYRLAVRRWLHLVEEIIIDAEYPELLDTDLKCIINNYWG